MNNRSTRAVTMGKDKNPALALPSGSTSDSQNKKRSRDDLDRTDEHVENLDELLVRFKQLIDDGNAKIQKQIESTNAALVTEISTLRNEVHQLKNDYARDFSQLSETSGKTEMNVQRNKDAIAKLPKVVELILTGVPYHQRERTDVIMQRLSAVLGFDDEDTPLVYAKRLARNPIAVGATPPILLQFAFKAARDDFFHRYLSKKDLNLNQLGFDVNKRVYLNENLTDVARNIKGLALKLKRSGKVLNVFSKDGTIFVKPIGDAVAQPIFNVDQLTCFGLSIE